MIGLLRKDLYVADKSTRLLLVFALVFSLMPNFSNFGNTYAVMLAVMLPLNSIAYDERCKWDRYAAMLPYQASQIVWSKYVLSFIYTLLGEVIVTVAALIRDTLDRGSVDWTETFEINAMLALIMLIVISFAFPFIYRFGSEKGRLVMLVCLGAGVGGALAVIGALADNRALFLPPVPVLAAIMAAVAILAIFVSFRLSVFFYKERQNGKYD